MSGGRRRSIEVKDAPDVRLTGVVITPGMKIASLTPADTNIETVMAHEGESLTGEFVGWQVTQSIRVPWCWSRVMASHWNSTCRFTMPQ